MKYFKKKKRKESKVHPSPKPPAPSNNLPPIRNNFYPELPQSDDDITNVYIPFNKNSRNVNNDIYQETGTIHEDRPILNNFTYGNPEPSSSSNYIKAETLFISDHEYDEPENFEGTSTFQSQPVEPPKIIPRNHIIDQIINEVYSNNYDQLYEFEKILKNPYEKIENKKYIKPPLESEKVFETFCGT